MPYLVDDFIRIYEEEVYAVYPICYAYLFISVSLALYTIYNNL